MVVKIKNNPGDCGCCVSCVDDCYTEGFGLVDEFEDNFREDSGEWTAVPKAFPDGDAIGEIQTTDANAKISFLYDPPHGDKQFIFFFLRWELALWNPTTIIRVGIHSKISPLKYIAVEYSQETEYASLVDSNGTVISQFSNPITSGVARGSLIAYGDISGVNQNESRCDNYKGVAYQGHGNFYADGLAEGVKSFVVVDASKVDQSLLDIKNGEVFAEIIDLPAGQTFRLIATSNDTSKLGAISPVKRCVGPNDITYPTSGVTFPGKPLPFCDDFLRITLPSTDISYGNGFPDKYSVSANLYTGNYSSWTIEYIAVPGGSKEFLIPTVVDDEILPNLDNEPYKTNQSKAMIEGIVGGGGILLAFSKLVAGNSLRMKCNFIDQDNYIYLDVNVVYVAPGGYINLEMTLGEKKSGVENDWIFDTAGPFFDTMNLNSFQIILMSGPNYTFAKAIGAAFGGSEPLLSTEERTLPLSPSTSLLFNNIVDAPRIHGLSVWPGEWFCPPLKGNQFFNTPTTDTANPDVFDLDNVLTEQIGSWGIGAYGPETTNADSILIHHSEKVNDLEHSIEGYILMFHFDGTFWGGTEEDHWLAQSEIRMYFGWVDSGDNWYVQYKYLDEDNSRVSLNRNAVELDGFTFERALGNTHTDAMFVQIEEGKLWWGNHHSTEQASVRRFYSIGSQLIGSTICVGTGSNWNSGAALSPQRIYVSQKRISSFNSPTLIQDFSVSHGGSTVEAPAGRPVFFSTPCKKHLDSSLPSNITLNIPSVTGPNSGILQGSHTLQAERSFDPSITNAGIWYKNAGDSPFEQEFFVKLLWRVSADPDLKVERICKDVGSRYFDEVYIDLKIPFYFREEIQLSEGYSPVEYYMQCSDSLPGTDYEERKHYDEILPLIDCSYIHESYYVSSDYYLTLYPWDDYIPAGTTITIDSV